MRETLARTAFRTIDIYENAVEGNGYGAMTFLKCAAMLFFGAIFLVILKMYIIFRHYNYGIFMAFFYLGTLLFGDGHSRLPHRHRNLHDDNQETE